jgi:hypothetical protein
VSATNQIYSFFERASLLHGCAMFQVHAEVTSRPDHIIVEYATGVSQEWIIIVLG